MLNALLAIHIYHIYLLFMSRSVTFALSTKHTPLMFESLLQFFCTSFLLPLIFELRTICCKEKECKATQHCCCYFFYCSSACSDKNIEPFNDHVSLYICVPVHSKLKFEVNWIDRYTNTRIDSTKPFVTYEYWQNNKRSMLYPVGAF